MFICLGYGDTTTNVQQAINQAMSQGPGGSGTANNARSNPMQPSPTYNKCNQQAMTQTGPLTPNAESIITSVMAAIMSYVLPGGGSAQSLLRGAAITQGSRLVVKAEIYQGQLNSCLESNGIR